MTSPLPEFRQPDPGTPGAGGATGSVVGGGHLGRADPAGRAEAGWPGLSLHGATVRDDARRVAGPGLGGPAISLPKGGGAIRNLGEKFTPRAATGAGAMTVPVPVSAGRSGFQPDLTLAYDSGAGTGPYGLGWQLSLPTISRRTDRGLPRYGDTDTYLLSGEDDLVPALAGGVPVVDRASVPGWTIARYRPRTEGSFARIERWTRDTDGDTHWRTLSATNVLNVYGRDAGSRIADPAEPGHVFTWLLCETRDDVGNAIVYSYKAEDGAGVDTTAPHEVGRTTADRTAQRYLKSIRYGNRVPLLTAEGRRPVDVSPAALAGAGFLFEVVLDYGEHDPDAPTPGDPGTWLVRVDPTSSYRAGFEIRTYRLCRRILMFHHFPEEPGVGADCLVTAVELGYSGDGVAAFLAAVFFRGYTRAGGGGYTSRSLPPVRFGYSPATIASTVAELDPDSAANLPAGIDDREHLWVDLDGEGLAGVLTDQPGGTWYRRNLGGARFAPPVPVADRPSLTDLATGRQQLVDLAGDGRMRLVQLGAQPAGFYRREGADGWAGFQPFDAQPPIDWTGPDIVLLDLTGDGRTDVLIADDNVVTWHPSLGETGYGGAERTIGPADTSGAAGAVDAVDEQRGPRLLRTDSGQGIFLADMSGDGFADLVRVRNGETCYWPNLGYGRFGAKVTMDGSPWFDVPEAFDPTLVRLADVDGIGTADLIYLGDNEARLWVNRSGNSFAPPHTLADLPHLDRLATVSVADLFGTGTACLVWSSPLPADAASPVRYLDLMGGTKPHLLTSIVNNLGGETTIGYAASTRFYLADRAAGTPWATRLPFPVQVVERVETVDAVARTRLVSTFSYHHGYFDPVEREFNGFGRIEQTDAESFVDYVLGVRAIDGTQDTAPELYQPPVTTRSWYHTGARPAGAGPVLHQLAGEYHTGAAALPEPALPAGVSATELREAVRAWRGLSLRQEVYSFDGTAAQHVPYGVVEYGYDTVVVQPATASAPAVCLATERESITLSYERDPVDPRVSHRLNLAVDEYGNVRTAAAVVYGRTGTDPALPADVTAAQQATHVSYGEQDYTPDIDVSAPVPAYRLRAGYEVRGYELTGATKAGVWFTRAELLAAIAAATGIGYPAQPTPGTPQRRPLRRARLVFRDNALAPLPAGQWDTLGIPYQSYHLAMTADVVATGYGGAVTAADLTAAGYVHLDGDADWWVPSGVALYPADPAAHFYVSTGARDPMGLETDLTLDRYDLLTRAVALSQATWARTEAVNDYRMLAAVEVTDPNGRRTAVRYDELGMVTATAVLGRAGSADGDTLADPTESFDYDPWNWALNGRPVYAHSRARERHGAGNTRFLESYVYSTGAGGVAMTKTLSYPGTALQVGPGGTAVPVHADPRWVGSGRTIANNKGNPVKQYEPYFSTNSDYEDEQALRELGATPVRYYDPLGRNLLTRYPNGTLARVEFTAWRQRLFDTNDTVRESQWYVDRGSPDPATDPEPVGDPQKRAAWLAAAHAGTPAVLHTDSLGRAVYTVADHGNGVTAAVRTATDLTGRYTDGWDTLGRHVAASFAAQNGAPVRAWSAEKGTRWVLQDVLGGMVRVWDEHGREFRTLHDDLRRPVGLTITESGGTPRCVQYTVFGDRHPDAATLGLYGVPHLVFDQAGRVRVSTVDFKGNPTSAERLLCTDYTAPPDWSAVAAATDYASAVSAGDGQLDLAETFRTAAEFDALNRPTRVTLPDATVLLPTYKSGGVLGALSAQIRGTGSTVDFLRDQDYDAKGQRLSARYGNDLVTSYFYDPTTFRLDRLLTAPLGADPADPGLQDLTYTYDPTGNITDVAAPQVVNFYGGAAVPAASSYTYDAVYQLVKATGRELSGLPNDAIRDQGDLPSVPAPPGPGDANAVRGYTEEYTYDLAGNLLTLAHRFPTQAGVGAGWTRRYRYAYQDNPADPTNRLTATSRPADPPAGPYTATYSYDGNGNMTAMPHLAALDWNGFEQLRHVDLGGGGHGYFVYGANGSRVRKVVDRTGSLQFEWVYLGAVTLFRRRNRVTGVLQMERWTVEISDDTGPFAQADTKTVDSSGFDPANPLGVPLVRYRYTDHLGSAVLETDGSGAVISYEEYHPYGTTAYRYGKPGTDLSLKRFRFSGHELDDETGLYYAGARYYAPWLGRWVSTDPSGCVDGSNLFRYCRNSPITVADPTGTQGQPTRTYDVRIQMPWFTGQEHPTIADFRKQLRSYGADLDPRVTDKNATIRYEPNLRYDPESHTSYAEPGGTWVLQAVVPPPPAQRAPRQPTAPPPPPPAPPPPAPPPPEPTPPPTETPPAAPPTPAPTPAPTPPAAPATPPPATGTPGTLGGGLGLAGPTAERFIWNHPFKGIKGGMRGNILEWMYGVPWRDNKPKYDLETLNDVRQVKSTSQFDKAGNVARSATRDAATAIKRNPSGTMAGKAPRAVVITPTDTPANVGQEIRTATAPGGGRKIPTGAAPPEHVRGLPGGWGVAGKALTGIGFALSAWALWGDYQRGDVPMGVGDALSATGGGLEIYAIAGGGTILGVSAMTAGLVIGGLGIAIASGVSGVRAYQAGDTAGAVAGGVGVAAGLAIAAGAIGIAAGVACAPVVLAVGAVLAIAVGVFHLGRHFKWW